MIVAMPSRIYEDSGGGSVPGMVEHARFYTGSGGGVFGQNVAQFYGGHAGGGVGGVAGMGMGVDYGMRGGGGLSGHSEISPYGKATSAAGMSHIYSKVREFKAPTPEFGGGAMSKASTGAELHLGRQFGGGGAGHHGGGSGGGGGGGGAGG